MVLFLDVWCRQILYLLLLLFAENGWDVERATSTYRFMEQAAIPPPGPLKNVEQKPVATGTSTGVTTADSVMGSTSVTTASGVGRPLGGATTVNGLQGATASVSFPNTLSKCARVCVREIQCRHGVIIS